MKQTFPYKTIMNWNEYKELSEKTLSTEFHCGKQVENLLHGVIGVLTELEELIGWNDEINKKEEVADIFWYIALLDRELDLNLEIKKFDKGIYQLTNETLIMQSFKTTCLLLDYLLHLPKLLPLVNVGKQIPLPRNSPLSLALPTI